MAGYRIQGGGSVYRLAYSDWQHSHLANGFEGEEVIECGVSRSSNTRKELHTQQPPNMGERELVEVEGVLVSAVGSIESILMASIIYTAD